MRNDLFGKSGAFVVGLWAGALLALACVAVCERRIASRVKCELCGRDSCVQVRDGHGGTYGMCDGCIRKALKIDGKEKE